jgi:hypothetical protein
MSARRNTNDLYWKASLQIPRKLQELFRVGPDLFFAALDDNESAHAFTRTTHRAPELFDEFALLARTWWRIYSERIRRFFVSYRWVLLFDIENEFSLTSFPFTKIRPPLDRLWADPHVLARDGKYFVFIEELPYSENKGHISMMEIREDGTHTTPRRILEKPYHLSNPCVFEHEGQLFLIPESARNRSVDLYRCVSFPDQWEHCETLLKDVHAVDTTVLFHRSRWWLFANIREATCGAGNDDLFLYHSDVLLGGHWRAHPRNPVVSDVTRARPAGKVFENDGRLYRPAQDCSVRYGYGIRIQEIVEISDSEYREREVTFIEPRRELGLLATHSFSRAGRIVVSDGLEETWHLIPAARISV